MAYRGRNTHTRLMCGAAMLALLGSGGVAAAEEQAQFNIAPQPLGSALNEFAVQSPWPILYTSQMTGGKTTAGVTGATDPQAALKTLLAGTGLSYRREGDTFLIVKVAQDPQSGSAAGGGAEIDALIVTAQKREENIQDVPIAMSAFTQEQLTDRQVAGGPDLMTQVPNFTFTKTNFSGYSIQIRGIGTQAISATTDAAVAVAFNNTPFIRNRFFEQEFYDLQRVEVLRGPQGTLYGRNATAGVVNIISAKPTFNFEAKASGDIANYESMRIEGMLNVPLVDDKVALRLAGAWTKRVGFVTNEITGNPIDGRDLWSTRVSLRFTPTDNFDANLIWEHFNEDDDRLRSGKQLCNKDIVTEVGGVPITNDFTGISSDQGFFSQGCKPASMYSPESFQTPNGFALPYYQPLSAIHFPAVRGLDPYINATQSRDLRVIESTVDPGYKAETDLVELQFNWDLTDTLTLTSETGYLTDTLFSTQDFNRFNTTPRAFDRIRLSQSNATFHRAGILDSNGVFCDPQIGCADRLVAVDLSTADSRHFSQEFRLASDYDGPFNFSLGANFLRYDTEDKYYVFINTLTMYSAIAPLNVGEMPPYVAGVSDNHECLRQGFLPPNPLQGYDVGACQYIDPNPITSLNDMGHNYFLSRNPYKLISYAIFGESYYNITDTLKFTGGLRWTVDKKDAPRIPSWVLAGGLRGSAASGSGYSAAELIELEWSEPTGRLTLDWKPVLGFTDETLLYASYAHGYKAGGSNPPANGLVLYATAGKNTFNQGYIQNQATHPRIFDAEFVDAFELGAKNTLFDNRVTLNTNVFYYDYKGYQISQIVDRSAVNLNFDATVWGAELEIDWRPLENLKLGFKGGYENTSMADGSQAIDLMNRTAGDPDWVLTRPFPALPSSCILPAYVITATGQVDVPGQPEGGNISGCEIAYVLGVDPLTGLAYVPNPTEWAPGFFAPAGYPGFDPATAPNGGAGIMADLSGNELPNAPNYTATLTADFTKPLVGDWLMTLHTDLYYQSEAWTRVFNTDGYDKLKAYTNVNLAAIFTNEDRGWKIMAYVKNVMDRDSITGAFLLSDDTGLTTNVFLTEPRLYGVRVTKDWRGGAWWTGVNPNHRPGDPYPLTVELGGQVQQHDAPYGTVTPTFVDAFSATVDPTQTQHRDLDWGDGREVKLTYRPMGSPWTFTTAARYGRTNGGTGMIHVDEVAGPAACGQDRALLVIAREFCDPTYEIPGYPDIDLYAPEFIVTPMNWSDASINTREEHEVVEFGVGRDVGIGLVGGGESSLAFAVRRASFESLTHATMAGIPNMVIPEGWVLAGRLSTHDRYGSTYDARREFEGIGPMVSWDAAAPLFGNEDSGHVDLDWSMSGGVLFGKQETAATGSEESGHFSGSYYLPPSASGTLTTAPRNIAPRETSVSVPVVDVSLGLAYEIQRIKVGVGYRWERYFNVLDAGFEEEEAYDRTISGPYFKLAIGFGG